MAVIGVAARTLLKEKVWCERLLGVMYCTSGSSSGKTAGTTTAEVKPPVQKPKPVVEPKPDITTYKVKEYYSHKEFSFYDIDSDMKQHRLKQPSSLT